VDPRAGLDDMEKRKLLTLPGLELRPLGRPASRYTDCANMQKSNSQTGTDVRGRVFHAGLLAEGPATGQCNQGFPCFSSILEQMLSWHPNYHAARLHM
jgi:hypothetical protein